MFCKLHQFMISSSFDNDKQLWGLTQRHIAKCPQCNRFYDLCRTMDTRLRKEKLATCNCVTDSLGRRVLEDTVIRQNTAPIRRFPLHPALAAAAIIVILSLPTVIFLMRRSSAPRPNQYELAVNSVRDIYASGTLAANRIAGDRAALTSLVNNPLESEIKNLTADTKSAVRFLIARVDTGATRPLPN